MATISYKTSPYHNREASGISFDVPNDMNIFEFKVMCVRLAHAMGYHINSISKSFGSIEYETEEDEKMRELFRSWNQNEFTGSAIPI